MNEHLTAETELERRAILGCEGTDIGDATLRRMRGETTTTLPETLPNGAVVLASTPVDHDRNTDGAAGWIVLASWRGGSEYVTWRVSASDLEAFWGHYFYDICSASDDYRERGGK